MPLTEATHKKAIIFLKVIKIGHEIMAKSIVVNSKTKEAFNNHDEWSIKTVNDSLDKHDLSSAGLKSLNDAYLTYWNESIGLDTEEFWRELNNHFTGFKRKDPLKYALEKGRFRNVHEGMSAHKNWDILKASQLLRSRLSEEDIERLDNIINQDELNRVKLLRKCLSKKNIPQTQYLKFGDCMGYVSNCELIGKHFNESEYKELYEIWNNFESK